MKTRSRTFPGLILLSSFLCMGQLAPAAVTIDEYGWTQITPSADSRIIYVSSSEGDDANDGLSPQTPKKTFQAGDSLLRMQHPDHLLLKSGDTFPNPAVRRWKSGRSAQEPIVISAYGSGPRPIIEIEDGHFMDHDGQARDYFAIIGLDFYKPNADPESPKFTNADSVGAFRLVGGGKNILIEDCRFRYVELVVQSYGSSGEHPQAYRDFHFRRNIVTDNWSHGSGTGGPSAQGIFLSGVHGYLLEENVFDHNGWNAGIAGAEANMFNHNVYIQYSNKAGGIMRGNIFARGAAHGMQARSGGTVERNIFVENAVSVNFGGVSAPTDPNVYDYDNRAYQNVIVEGRLMHPTNNNYPRTTAVWALPVTFIPDVDLIDNIIANRRDNGSNQALLTADGGTYNVDGNIIYQWDASQDMTDPTWSDPERSLAQYAGTLGEDSTNEAYYNALRERGPGEFPWELSPYAAINYIREGFNKDPVGGYYRYDGQPEVAVTGISAWLDSLELSAGESSSVVAYVSPANASNGNITWHSSDTSVAEINQYGQVFAKTAGTAELIATAEGGHTDSIALSVTGPDVPVTSVTASALVLGMDLYTTRVVSAEVTPANASNSTVVWTSSNESIITVDQSGLISAVGPGTASVTVTTADGGYQDGISVTVKDSAAPWAGFPRDADGNVDTGDFLGWILVTGDWVWLWDTNTYAYIPESFVTPTGSWAFLPRSN